MFALFLVVGIVDLVLLYMAGLMPLSVPILQSGEVVPLVSRMGICVRGEGCVFTPHIPFIHAAALVIASMALVALFKYLTGLRVMSMVVWIPLLLSVAFSLPLPLAYIYSGGEFVMLTNMYSSYTPLFYLLASIHVIVENASAPAQKSIALVDYSDLTEDTVSVEA